MRLNDFAPHFANALENGVAVVNLPTSGYDRAFMQAMDIATLRLEAVLSYTSFRLKASFEVGFFS